MQHPRLKTLPHEVPWWVADDAAFFVTVCARTRHRNTLCVPSTASRLVASVAHRIGQHQWEVPLLLLMPDHLHLIARFNPDPGMERIVSAWKRYTARHLGIEWQRGFFDHRLRNEDERARKEAYIRMNPVRAGLVAHAGDWPYVWSW